jgi:hypothetical protein
MDVGHADNFPWTFFTLLAVAGVIGLIRWWVLRTEKPPARGFEVVRQDEE